MIASYPYRALVEGRPTPLKYSLTVIWPHQHFLIDMVGLCDTHKNTNVIEFVPFIPRQQGLYHAMAALISSCPVAGCAYFRCVGQSFCGFVWICSTALAVCALIEQRISVEIATSTWTHRRLGSSRVSRIDSDKTCRSLKATQRFFTLLSVCLYF